MVMEMESFTRGDLVWARVVYPHQWWPGFVLKTDIFGVLVSFFGYQNSRYFLESEISSFEQSFKTHIKNCTNKTLLDYALKCLGQEVVLSLTCPGHVKKLGSSKTALFQPQRVLGFVRSVAVWPWVEDEDFVSAVHLFAETTAYRHYLVTSRLHSKMQAGRDSVEKMNLISGELDSLKMMDDCQVFSEEVKNNLPTSLINRNMANLFPTKSLRPWDEEQPGVSSGSQIEQQKTQSLRDNAYGEKENNALSLIPYMESSVNCLSLKRQLDQSSVSEPPLKLRKTLTFSIKGADSYLWGSRIEHDVSVSDMSISGKALSGLFKAFNSMPFSSNGAYDLRRNTTGSKEDLFDSFSSGSQVRLITQKLSTLASESSTYICSSKLMDLVQNVLNFSRVRQMSHCSDTVEICMVQKLIENVNTLDNSAIYISSANLQQPQESETILKYNGTCISCTHDATENMLEFSAAQSVSDYAIETHTGDDEASDCTADQHKMLPSNDDKFTSVKMNREVRVNESFGDRFKDNKKLSQLIISDSAFKPKVGELAEVQTNISLSKTLHMKFPKDYSLPSKEELVKKFSPFGRVDPLRTMVYFYTGSARVVFLQALDAVAAYEYAKRKKIVFGKQNVKFWLDPFDDKRGGSKSLVLSPEFNLKSCLKKSMPLEKKDRRCPRKVRFLMET